MSRGRLKAVHVVLILAALTCFARAALMGISDPSEGRYAQIAREMVDSGDWVVPHWFGVVHLEKPPLAYWAGAAGIELFGRNQFAIRFFPVLALLLAAWLTAQTARRLLGPEAEAGAAAVVGLAPYAIMVGAALLTDGFVMLSVALFSHAVTRRFQEDDRCCLDWAAVALGIGFLAKGHAILLFTILPLAFARSGFFRELWRPRRLLILALLILPWPIAVQLRFPQFLSLHATKLVHFVATGQEHHRAPVFIYLVVLLLGLAPFGFYLPRACVRIRRPAVRYQRLVLLLPLIVLTAIPSRSWTYIFPALPAAVVLAARGRALRGETGSRGRLALLCALIAIALGLVAALVHPSSEKLRANFNFLPVACGALLCLALWLAWSRRLQALVVACGVALLIDAAVVVAAMRTEAPFHIHRRAAMEVERLSRPGHRVVLVGTGRPSIAFYLERPVVVAGVISQLENEAKRWGKSDHYLPSTELQAILQSDTTSVIVINAKDIEDLHTLAPERKPRFLDANTAVITGPVRDRQGRSPD